MKRSTRFTAAERIHQSVFDLSFNSPQLFSFLAMILWRNLTSHFVLCRSNSPPTKSYTCLMRLCVSMKSRCCRWIKRFVSSPYANENAARLGIEIVVLALETNFRGDPLCALSVTKARNGRVCERGFSET